jgi:hypothetical protein
VSQRGPFDLAAGKLRGILGTVEAQLLQQMPCLVRVVTGAEPGLDIGECCCVTRKIRLLWQVADGRAGLDETRSAVRLDETSHDLEER